MTEREVLEIEEMKSGRLCLNLNSCIEWETFPDYAENLARDLGAKVLRKTDSFDIRIWELSMQGEVIRLVFNDFPVMVSLESTSEAGDSILEGVKSFLESETR